MKTILISGGSDGLGLAIARLLAPEHKVIITSRNEANLKAAAQEVGCEYKVGDVRDYAQMERVVSEIGDIDCLVNNAGIWLQGPLDETDPARIHETLEVNVLGVINLTKAVIPRMKQKKAGLIININSQAGLNVRAGWPVYSASKSAITGFTKSMQQELEPFGIGVAGLYPGTINTQLFAKADVPKDLSHALDPATVARAVAFMVECDGVALFPEMGIKRFPHA